MYPNLFALHNLMEEAGIADPQQEIWQLLDILSGGEIRRLDAELESRLGTTAAALVAARRAETPLAYIVGETPFMGLRFICRPGALIPRAETELLVRAVLELLREKRAVTLVDMCTGSGNIGVALAMQVPQAVVHASDISAEALALAQEHVTRYRLADRMKLYQGDMFAPLAAAGIKGQVDLVVCNPPYLPSATYANLPQSIRAHEPEAALNAGPYGIDFFRRLIKEAPDFLLAGGWLAFEIGAGQEGMARRLLQKAGAYAEVQTYADAAGVVRGFLARKQ